MARIPDTNGYARKRGKGDGEDDMERVALAADWDDIITTSWGDATARRRTLLFATRAGRAGRPALARPPPGTAHPSCATLVGPGTWKPGPVTPFLRVGTPLGDQRRLPHAPWEGKWGRPPRGCEDIRL